MDELSFPPIPADLLDTLDRLYPERCAELSQSEREVFFMAGQRSVIRCLRRVFDEQNTETTNPMVL